MIYFKTQSGHKILDPGHEIITDARDVENFPHLISYLELWISKVMPEFWLN